MAIEKSNGNASYKPAKTIAGVEESEGQPAFMFGQYVGNDGFEQRVLYGVADAPQRHGDQYGSERACEHQGRKQGREHDSSQYDLNAEPVIQATKHEVGDHAAAGSK